MSADYREDYPPPPSYDETVSAVTRQPPFPRPESLQTHHITVGPDASSLSLPFPDPADFWQGRDITTQDWAAFASEITAVLTGGALDDNKQADKDANRDRRVKEILAAWNSRVFERRGLTVVLNRTEPDAGGSSSAGTTSRFNFGPDKFGIKIGGGIIGVDFSSKPSDKK
ncbi:hypothetical protein CSOJ01_03247 [Colletotrichum sojae]|uniref:Uncharacterized protein n=1 Tax=Colletotrichum sojae TaxID=2175907 RepID=A0A8H6JNU3_9PEZI|nr:hypothetical protein CSOJ01_03247 [Colletotrichum sojae]